VRRAEEAAAAAAGGSPEISKQAPALRVPGHELGGLPRPTSSNPENGDGKVSGELCGYWGKADALKYT
jgi:hypothetical protein